MKSYTTIKTKILGELLLVASPTELLGVYFADRKHAATIQPDWKSDPKHPVLRKTGEEINDFLNGKRTEFTVPVHYEGTEFQNEIWRQIALIPFGETITYTELATRAGVADAVRAAGTATGANPISIIIPCHRVIGKRGNLTGYAGGLDRKKRLLEIETNVAPFKLSDSRKSRD